MHFFALLDIISTFSVLKRNFDKMDVTLNMQSFLQLDLNICVTFYIVLAFVSAGLFPGVGLEFTVSDKSR